MTYRHTAYVRDVAGQFVCHEPGLDLAVVAVDRGNLSALMCLRIARELDVEPTTVVVRLVNVPAAPVGLSRFSPAERAALTKIAGTLYGTGTSIREIAGRLAISYTAANRLVHDSGVPVRGRGWRGRRRPYV